MSYQITTAFVNQYRDNVTLLSQQKGSKLRAAVRNESQQGEYEYFDQIGATAAQRVTSRHGDTSYVNTPHSRRRVGLVDYDWADLVDKLDKIRTLNDPTNSYALSAAYAMGRAQDDEIIAALGGTAYTGQAGGTSVALPSSQKIAAGGASFTLTKLLNIKEILDGADVDPELPRFIALAVKQMTSLLNTTEVKSADYNTVKALVRGDIDTFMGFKFIQTQRLVLTGGSRYCYAWVQDGVLLSMGMEPTGRIDELPTKRYSTQVYYCGSFGATRMEEAKVVEIACTES